MSESTQTVSHAQVISTFGTSFWIRSDSAADYILHPVFLRFLMLCIGIYALLDTGDEVQHLIGWQLPVFWLSMAMAVITGYVVLGGLTLNLHRRGFLRRIYTPFLLFPIVMIAEATEQGVVLLLQAGEMKSLPQTLVDLTRNMLMIMLMDVMHVQFVVANHPLGSRRPPGQASAARVEDWEDADNTAPSLRRAGLGPVAEPAPLPTPPPVTTDIVATQAKPEAVPAADQAAIHSAQGNVVRIADRSFAIAEIQSVRTEDHYLNVVTRTARSMLRAKLSDIVALHDGRHGVQINRSQWVAFAAIDTVRDEDNGQVTLHLVNGDSATVSRTRRLMFMQLYNSQRGGQS